MSDLREVLKRSIAELEYCLDHAYSPDVTTIKRLKSIAALAQPEAVEPVAWCNGDELSNMLDDRVVAISGKRSGWRNTALYTTPPLAPDERMRRALERARDDIKFYGLDDFESTTADVLAYIDEALSRADDGKESEGGIIGPININPKILSRVSVSSDPTPPDLQPGWKQGERK